MRKYSLSVIVAIVLLVSVPVTAFAWTVQNPKPTSSNIYGVYFTSGTTGYIAGAGGSLLKTVDSGDSWDSQNSGITDQINYITCPGNSSTCYAVGQQGKILKTTDGGATWNNISITGVTTQLYSISCSPSDADLCYMVGASGLIRKTTDGGVSWTSQSVAGITSILQNVDCENGDMTHCYAVGASGRILKTSDGNSWATQTSTVTTTLTGVSCPAANTCYVSGGALSPSYTTTLLKTTDGGTTWTAQTTPASDIYLYSVKCPSATTCYAAGTAAGAVVNPQTIFKTTDGGTSWSQMTTSTALNELSCADESTCYAAGAGGILFRTTDGFVSNTNLKVSITTSSLYATDCPVGTNTCYAAGDGGFIGKTTDSGTTWTALTSGTATNLRGITCPVDTETCFAAGLSGIVLKTTDSGASWSSLASGSAVQLNDIACQGDKNTCYISGNNGTILKTSDSGTNWSTLTTGTTEAMNSIYCYPDDLTCIAVGSGGKIIKTIDGGSTWTAMISGVASTLRSIDCSDSSCFISGDSGTLISSTDTGDTWSVNASGVSNLLYSITCADSSNCYAFGDSGAIIRTTNGGISWTSSTFGTKAVYGSTCPADATTCFTVGNSGQIAKDGTGYSEINPPFAIDLQADDATWHAINPGAIYNVDFTDTDSGLSSLQYSVWSGPGKSGTELIPWHNIRTKTGLGTYTADWGVKFASLTEGINYISVRSFDKAGNTSETSDAFTMLKDTTAPAAIVNQTGDDTWRITGGTTYDVDFDDFATGSGLATVQYTVWNATGTSAGTGSEIIPWTSIATNIGTQTYTTDWPVDFGALAEGVNFVSVRSTDNAGLVSDAATDAFYIMKDTTPPVQSDWSPASGTLFASGAVSLTFVTSENADCKWSLTDQSYAAMTAACANDGPAALSCAVSGLPGGTSTVFLACRDSHGIEDTDSTNSALSYNYDNTPPVITDNQSGIDTWYATDPALSFDIDFEDAGGGTLDLVQYAVWTASGMASGTGSETIAWATISENIASNSYTADFQIPFASMSEGINYVSVRAYDFAGNLSTATDTFYFLKDTVAPVFAGIASTASCGADCLTIAWDAATDSNHPVSYNVYSSSTSGGHNFSTPDFSTTSTSADISALAYGYHYFVVRAEDSVGNEDTNSIEASGYVQEFTTPAITVNQAGDDTWYAANPGAVFDVDFSDAGGSLLATVQYAAWTATGMTATESIAWATIATGIDATTYTADWDVDFAALPEGVSYISVKAIDGDGNTSVATDSFYIRKDTAAPLFAGLSSIVNCGPDCVTLSWDAATDTNGPVTYNIYTSAVSGGEDFNAPALSTDVISINMTGLSGGDHFFVVRAEDSLANEDSNSSELSVFIADTDVPYVLDHQAGDNIWYATDPGAVFDVDFADGGGMLDYVQYSAWTGADMTATNSIPWADIATGIAAASYTDNWGVDFDSLSEGTTHISVRAVDTDAHVIVATDVFYIRKDTTPPSFAGIADVTNCGAGCLTLSWLPATDNLAVTYNIYPATSSAMQDFATPGFSTTATTIDITGLPYGHYYYVVRAADSAGNTELNTIELTAFIEDPSAPVITDNQPDDDTWHSADPASLYDVDFSDDGGSLLADIHYSAWTGPGMTATQSVDWTPVATGVAAASYTTDWTIGFASLSEGINYISVRALDGDGSSTVATDVFYIKKDTQAPSFAGLTSLTRCGADCLRLAWDPASDVSPVTYSGFAASATGGQDFATPGFSTTATTIDITGLPYGHYYYVVRAADSAGNTELNTIELTAFIEDPSAPVITDNQPDDDTWHSADPASLYDVDFSDDGGSLLADIHYSAWTGPGMTATQSVDWTPVATGVAAASYTTDWTIGFASLSEGINYISVRALDGDGSSTVATDVFYIKKDTQAPVTIISSPASAATVSGSLTVTGTAYDPLFTSWSLSYGPGEAPPTWKTIADGSSPITSSAFTTWDTATLSGTYTLKLEASDISGKTSVATASVTVANTIPFSGTIASSRWYLLNMPVQPANPSPSSIYGTGGEYKIYRWDPQLTTADPHKGKYTPPAGINAGDSYWVKAYFTDLPYSYSGSIVDTTQTYITALHTGWNQIGTPYNRSYPWDSVQVRKSGVTYDLATAISDGIVSSVLLEYNSAASTWIQNGTGSTMDPAKGYFLYANTDAELIFAPGAGLPGGMARVVRDKYAYRFKISAHAPASSDTDNYVASSTSATSGYDPSTDLIDPPAPADGNYTSLYFTSDRHSHRLANDTRGNTASAVSYSLAVETNESASPITLTWDPSELPSSYTFTLVVASTGERIDMAQVSSYTFTTSTDPVSTTPFTIEITRKSLTEDTASTTITKGWNLISVPLDPEVTAAIAQLGDDLAQLDVYQYFDGKFLQASDTDIQAGIGYWIHVAADTRIDITGVPVPSDGTVEVPLKPGWNVLGNPFDSQLVWGDNITLACGSSTYSLNEAISAGMIAPSIYLYDGAYTAQTPGSTLYPWKGYFLKSSADCTIILRK